MREYIYTIAAFLSIGAGIWLSMHDSDQAYICYIASLVSLVYASGPNLAEAVVRIYDNSGLQGVILLFTYVGGIGCLIAGVAFSKPEDRGALLINGFVAFFGFATGVGYSKIPEKGPKLDRKGLIDE